VVEGHGLELFAGRRLRRAQAGDPGLLAGQCALQRLDLARVAAGLARLHRIVEAVDAEAGDEVLHRVVARGEHLQAAAVAALGRAISSQVSAGRRPVSSEKMPMSMPSPQIMSVSTMSSAPRLLANTVGRVVARDVAQQLFDADGLLGHGADQFEVGKIGQVFAQHCSLQ
jgi:hypothetical protein